MGELQLHDEAIAEISARLDLRAPNTEAVRSIDYAISQYFDVDGRGAPFEAVDVESIARLHRSIERTGLTYLVHAGPAVH